MKLQYITQPANSHRYSVKMLAFDWLYGTKTGVAYLVIDNHSCVVDRSSLWFGIRDHAPSSNYLVGFAI